MCCLYHNTTITAVQRCYQDAFGDTKKSLYSNQFVQEAVLQCVQRLSEQQPDTRVGLITFNYQVYTWWSEAWFKKNLLFSLKFVSDSYLICLSVYYFLSYYCCLFFIPYCMCDQVTMHGYENFTSQFLSGADLTDSDFLKEAAASFPSPPPLSQTSDYLQRQVMG